MMKPFLCLAALAVVAGCASTETSRRADPGLTLPAMNTFAARPARTPSQSNTTLANDFLELTFMLENGAEMPVFSRFEGPITVGFRGSAPQSLETDLSKLLARLRSEARIDISRATPGTTPSIVVEPVTRKDIQRVAPTAACFVRPNVSSFEEYKQRRSDPRTFWTRLERRERMAVFLPSDVSPQEMRDCLHEEISQALGPVNDVYRLSQSIFNDDNFHTVLTGYDMLILRAYYHPSLQSGMSEDMVAAHLPGILQSLNPSGGRAATPGRPRAPTSWDTTIEKANSPGRPRSARQRAARRAVELAKGFGANDTRLAYSYYTLGRLLLPNDTEEALAAFLAAGRIYQSRPDTRVQEAHVAMQLAAFQLSAGRPDVSIALVDQAEPAVRSSEHAALLSLLLMVKAESLLLKGEAERARAIQTEALGWARYGFGAPEEIAARVDEISSISPRTRFGEQS